MKKREPEAPKSRKDFPAPARGFRQLQRGLTGERTLIGASYMDDPSLLRAYLDFYWPISFEQTRRALAVTGLLAGKPLNALRILDVGSGPGPVAAAFAASGAAELTLLDQSARALELARSVIPSRVAERRSVAAGDPGTAAALKISTVAMDIASPEPATIPLWGSADCVSFGHSLNEVAAGSGDRVAIRARLLTRYAEALAPGGTILVVEPALLSTSRDLIAVRNLLVSAGWRVLAPCVGRASLDCPALAAGEGQTCHDEIRWKMPESVERLARENGLDKESLKMTWFLLLPPGSIRPDSIEKEPSAYRVVSDPMLNKGGRIRRLLCGASGRFPLSAPSGGADATRSGFASLERGAFIQVNRPEARENGWGVGPETGITVLA
jgi:SAM-dependent methyltransferase